MSHNCKVDIQTFSLPAELQRYFSALYSYRIETAEGLRADECLYPDWAGMHFNVEGVPSLARFADGEELACAAFAANGPTSKAMNVRVGPSLSWSLALNPLGWAHFADVPASALANRIVDGAQHPAFARLAPILDIVRESGDDLEGTAAKIGEYLSSVSPPPIRHEPEIAATHEALRDPDIGDVEALVDKVGVSRRTVERLASRYFGFSPKLLLRRQRFLRSLGKFTIDPDRSWSASLDGHYVDQAHFVRDFRSFMGMTPSEYAHMPHPILEGIFTRRLAEQGA